MVAYCIMDNHVHIIIIAEKPILVKFMKRINISYAMSYNQRHKRIGPVFQDRFKSENIDNEKYLLGAIRYIHNNPVQAGIVSKVQDYKWSSLGEYTGKGLLLVDKEAKNQIIDDFISDKNFLNFHNIEDERDYLEITEEFKQLKNKRANKIIEDYFIEKGITDFRELKSRDELIMKLINETEMSYRKIAELTCTTLNGVQKANKKYPP